MGLPLVESGLIAGVGIDSDSCSAAPSHNEPLLLVEWSLAQVAEPFLSMIRGPVQVFFSECAS